MAVYWKRCFPMTLLSGEIHLHIGLRDILGIRGMDSYNALFFSESGKGWEWSVNNRAA